MKSVIVAGGLGFLGSHLAEALLGRNDIERIVVLDNLWTGTRRNEAYLDDPRVQFVYGDVERFTTDLRFDEVYHLASPASPQWYSRAPVRTISANVLGAFRLRELMAPGGRFCFTSTSEVYGDPLVSPQPESYRGSVDCTGPRASYDESKRCTEAFLFECARVHGMDVRVVRLFNVYGPRTRPDDGRAISNFVSRALAGLPIVVYGDGQQSRSWGYVDDIVAALARLFWRDPVAPVGPVNIGNDREVPVIEIARYVAGLVPGASIVFGPPAPQDPTNRRPDLTLARRLLPGWRCETEYEEGVRLTLDWFAGEAGMARAEPKRAEESGRPGFQAPAVGLAP